MNHEAHAVDAAASAVASKVTTAGATTTVVGWFLSSEFAVLAGIVIGLAGLAVNWYYQHKNDRRTQAESEARSRREQLEHEARMREFGQ